MKIDRMNKGDWGKLRAFFDVRTDEGFVIKGFKLVEGINGLFVGMPSQKGKDDEYFDTIFAERDLRDDLTEVALEAYNSNSTTEPEDMPLEPPAETEEEETSKVAEEVGELNVSNKEEGTPVQPFSDDDVPF